MEVEANELRKKVIELLDMRYCEYHKSFCIFLVEPV